MTTRIDGLQERGLVKRRTNRQDKRSVIVRLTAKGKRLIDSAIASRFEDASNALAKMSAKDRDTLSSALRSALAQLENS